MSFTCKQLTLVFVLLGGIFTFTGISAQEDCGLNINKQCQVIRPDAGEFSCSDAKPIDSLAMAWKGQDDVTIKAWKGNPDGDLLAEFFSINNGDEVSVSGMGGSPNDQFWEVFDDAGVKLGVSNFHISCSDDNMDGPEDCGSTAGNGKSDDPSFLNLWSFEGMSGSGMTLDCNPEPPPPAESCEFEQPLRPACEYLGKPSELTFVYSGGACDPDGNDQGSKTACEQTGSLAETATISSTNSGLAIVPAIVHLGESFTVSGSFGSATILQLETSAGSQDLNIHTSCSAPLAVGDVFGGVTLNEFNGAGNGTLVNYFYTVGNSGIPRADVTLVDNLLGVVGGPLALDTNEEKTFVASAVITETTTNIVDVTIDAGATICASDSTTVTVTEACDTCKGGTTEMVLMYLETAPAQITIYDDSSPKADRILFDGLVYFENEIPITRRLGQDKFNNDVSIFIDGVFHAKVHTSCSKPLGAGLQIGDFEIVEARSKDNGLMCALDTCNVSGADLQFHDRELRLLLTNQGDTNIAIERIIIGWPQDNGKLVEIKRDGDSIHKGEFSSGLADIDSGWEGDLNKRTIKHGETDTLKFKFDYNAILHGDYSVTVEFNQGCSLTRTFAAQPEVCDVCKGGTTHLEFQYQGDGLADVVVYDDSSANPDRVLFQGLVNPAGLLQVTRRPGEDKLNNTISLYIDGLLHTTIHTSCSQPIGPGLVVGDFRIVDARSKDNGLMCPLNTCDVADLFFEFKDNELRYPISNKGDVDVAIERLEVLWLQEFDLVEVKREGDTLQQGIFMPPFVEFDAGWTGDIGKRQIQAGDTDLIKLIFNNDVTPAGAYRVTADFDQGCSVSRTYLPPQEGADFVCEKPVTTLRVLWQGNTQIDIVVWDGGIGSDIVTTLDGVFPGQLLVVDGFSGDESDVYWEIFDSVSGEMLGISRFHISCSDNDMNGPEDCGKPVGDGKDSNDEFLNTWSFDGMTADGDVLICTVGDD